MQPSATYSPDDDKIRIFPVTRFSKETYDRVKAAGFSWAPKQECFYAVWNPTREDLAEDLCGEIEDDDKSLIERAEERAERFEDYSDNRLKDAESAKRASDQLSDGIPFGQPILVGHHSQRRAERQAEKIKAAMGKAVRMWKTAQYWEERAAACVQHAKYKELPAVRYRRIKKLESELRGYSKQLKEAQDNLEFWSRPDLTLSAAISKANYEHAEVTLPDGTRSSVWTALERDGMELDAVKAQRQASLPHWIEIRQRWVDHLTNRIAYERGMLQESGGIKADKFDLQVGGRVLAGGKWATILKITRKDGVVSSVSTNNTGWPRVVKAEQISSYEPPAEGAVEAVKAATKLPPICNYPGIIPFARYNDETPNPVEARAITKAQWDAKYKDYKGTFVVKGHQDWAEHRVRYMFLSGDGKGKSFWGPVYLSDEKIKYPPAKSGQQKPVIPEARMDLATAIRQSEASIKRREEAKKEDDNPFALMEQSLKHGIEAVSSYCLFPTPAHVAEQMVQLAEIESGMPVLEPSAGTGNLVAAVHATVDTEVLAYEINPDLCNQIRNRIPSNVCAVRCKDFLEVNEGAGYFARVVMNPPFDHGSDIIHVQHALNFLRPGGRLVAIVANGPKQQKELQPLADQWIELPAGTFQGTNVRTAIVVISKE
jgi:protein-L-isoaspartate O-methyltransferase